MIIRNVYLSDVSDIDNRPYATVDDLLRVPGIGERNLAQLRDLVTVEQTAQ